MRKFNTIIVESDDGCVTDVRNLPKGWTYYVEYNDSYAPAVAVEKGMYKCPCCDKRSRADKSLVNHSIDHITKETKCKNCGVKIALLD